MLAKTQNAQIPHDAYSNDPTKPDDSAFSIQHAGRFLVAQVQNVELPKRPFLDPGHSLVVQGAFNKTSFDGETGPASVS